ncbi:acyl-CoA N-acyltransferase [Sporodiniella umbellata]|nr:acyl-CoA N-acyltransferase [Sporodiniella umbellata]
MNPTFRSATIKDIDAILKCEDECFLPEECMSKAQFTKLIGYTSKNRPELFQVAILAEEVVGFICATQTHEKKINRKAVYNQENKGRIAVGQTLCLIPKVQRLGIGRKFVSYFLNRLKSTGKYERINMFAKKHLKNMYQDLGFTYQGPSSLTLGSSQWFDFTYEF